MEQALEELQDKLWDLDKVCHCFQKTSINHIFAIVFKKRHAFSSQSWENNLVFYGINIMKDEEHNPDLITGRVTKSQYPILISYKKGHKKAKIAKKKDWIKNVCNFQVREILKVSLGIARDVPILRVKRAHTGAWWSIRS